MSSLSLHLIGFHQQNVISVHGLTQIVSSLPADHLSNLKEIEYDPNRLTQKSVGYFMPPRVMTQRPNFASQGEYNLERKKITLYKAGDRHSLLHTLFHELGHHVYHTVIGSIQKKQWVTQVHPGAVATSKYGATNASEDFAESYAGYILQPEVLQKIPDKYLFVREKVFRSARPNLAPM